METGKALVPAKQIARRVEGEVLPPLRDDDAASKEKRAGANLAQVWADLAEIMHRAVAAIDFFAAATRSMPMRTPRSEPRPYALRRYKGSPVAKRATRRGGNPGAYVRQHLRRVG